MPLVNQQDALNKLMDIEWDRCSKDPIYFMKKYCYIQHATRGKLKFELYPFQEDLIELCVSTKRVCVLKGRQMGISTVMGALETWYIIFHPDHKTLVIAMTQKVAVQIVDKVKLIINNLPQWIRNKMPEIREWNQLSVGLANDSKIEAASSASNSGRSIAASRLIVDECVLGTTKIKIRNKITKEVKEVNIEELFNIEYK